MYTDDIELTGDNVLHLLYASKKYILQGLQEKCSEYLTSQIAQDNVCSILTHSLHYQDGDLAEKCMDLIAPNIRNVWKTEAFQKMSHDALLKVVSCDFLADGAEADLFDGCLQWGKRKAGDNSDEKEIRTLLGECIYKIRFTCIDAAEFARRFGTSNVLTKDEQLTIMFYATTKQSNLCEELAALGFDVFSRMTRASRYQHQYHAPGTSNIIDITSKKKKKPNNLP